MARFDSVGFAKQSALGTKNVTMAYFPPVENAEVNANTEIMSVEETTGSRFPTDVDYGTRYFEGSIGGVARSSSLPRLLSGFFGAPTSAALGSGAFSHIFNPATAANLVPHSILFNRTDPSPAITDLIWDALGNQISMAVDPNGYLMYNGSWVAISNDDTQTEPTVTLDVSKRFTFDQAKVYVTVDAGSEAEIKVGHWGFEYNNNIPTDNFALGQKTLFTVQEGNADATLTFTPKTSADLSTYYRYALAAAPNKLKVRLTATGSIIGGGFPYKFEVIFYNTHVTAAPAAISAGEVLNNVEVSCQAAYDSSVSKFIQLEVDNTIASY